MCYKFSEILDYLIQYLLNKHKIYLALKYIMQQFIVDFHYLVNLIELKLL